MKVRLQPLGIVVDSKEPFKYDMLDRKKPVEILTSLIANLEGPCTLAVDAEWGQGKTTFFKIWAAYLRQQRFPVVEFNAWETDDCGNPFIALSTELAGGLQNYTDDSLATKIHSLKEQATQVASRTVPAIIQEVISSAIPVPVVGTGLGQAAASWLKDSLSAYEKDQQSIKAFKDVLQDMAESLSESSGGRPLIVMIDELDRCRPSYAVQLLEVAKHLFTVERIVFVLAVNRSELAHSVKALYGDNFDAKGYLGRFFDADFRLPHPDRDKFIADLLRSTGISDYFDRALDRHGKEEQPIAAGLLKAFFRVPHLSLRRIQQAIHRLGLVLASLPSERPSFAEAAAVALIVRAIDVDLYYGFFVAGDVDDLEVSKGIFGHYLTEDLRRTSEGQWFDANLIKAFRERERRSGRNTESRLLESYEKSTSESPAGGIAASIPKEVANAALIVRSEGGRGGYMYAYEFKEAIDRLELFSEHFITGP